MDDALRPTLALACALVLSACGTRPPDDDPPPADIITTDAVDTGLDDATPDPETDLVAYVEAHCDDPLALEMARDAAHYPVEPGYTQLANCRTSYPQGCHAIDAREWCYDYRCALCIEGECVLMYPDDRCQEPHDAG